MTEFAQQLNCFSNNFLLSKHNSNPKTGDSDYLPAHIVSKQGVRVIIVQSVGSDGLDRTGPDRAVINRSYYFIIFIFEIIVT